ncbi:MAG: hypothetical protein LBM93_04945, partial [Oscillospiraceae bacterium]|nr:hypothetical protein [Oscillospiraceae bacterium]
MQKFKRFIAGTLAIIFVGQVLVFGDGNSEGILHANTLTAFADSIQQAKNEKELAEEFENITVGLGEVDYFNAGEPSFSPMAFSAQQIIESTDNTLTVSGCVIKGNVDGYNTINSEPISIHIFDGDYNELNIGYANEFGEFSVSAKIPYNAHIKIECNGYLPIYLKDFGTGNFLVSAGYGEEGLLPLEMIPGDTTYNYDNDNQWSDDNLTADDSEFVEECLGETFNATYNSYLDFNQDGIITSDELSDATTQLYSDSIEISESVPSELDLNADGYLDINDTEYFSQFNSSENYHVYMDINGNGTIEQSDVDWFSAAYEQYGNKWAETAYRLCLDLYGNAYFPYSHTFRDTDLFLNGYEMYVNGDMSFHTENLDFWSDNAGAYLDLMGGTLEIENSFNFRTSPGDSEFSQALTLGGGTILIGSDFNFGQVGCNDIIVMQNDYDYLQIGGNWNYVTDADIEGLWTAGEILLQGTNWQVNEASGAKSVYSSGTHTITFACQYGKQYILWDNS